MELNFKKWLEEKSAIEYDLKRIREIAKKVEVKPRIYKKEMLN